MAPDPSADPFVKRAPEDAGEVDEARAKAAEHALGAARAAGTAARETAALTRVGWQATRRFIRSAGAGETGLAKLIDVTALGSAGDAFVTVSLAGTLFFSVPTGEARGRVFVYLLVTMAPFALLAPVVGPLLDRLGHGRRFALAGTFGLRALLALVMAAAVSGTTDDGRRLYPAAFGVLVCIKAFGVARSAAMPRLLPAELDLVSANSRVSLASLAALSTAGPLGAGVVTLFGPEWSLRVAFLIFVVGVVLSVRLPKALDDERGAGGRAVLAEHLHEGDAAPDEVEVPDAADTVAAPPRAAGWAGRLRESRARRVQAVGPAVFDALRANAGIRAFAGFLLLHLAFLLRAHPMHGLPATALIAAAAAAAGVGSAAGASLGSALRGRPAEVTVLACLVASAAAAALGFVLFGLITILVVAVVAGVSQTLGKLALDAMIQRDVAPHVRASAFARSETLLQLSWVAGAGAGTLLRPHEGLGFGLAALALLVPTAMALRGALRGRARRRHR
ncbi:MFS transporter [Motilibacter peucedani]|uniref:MFS transporter n=1 Tax=Motilibacter peucedani TaxID=598650 RepID=A0A420XK72_9ACTN|nr:MFS transporter [Motilibacter peucedani]RKS68522.1 MFS transporter [Motilibacter peucedani]